MINFSMPNGDLVTNNKSQSTAQVGMAWMNMKITFNIDNQNHPTMG